MKRIFVFVSLLLLSCEYPVQTKQQKTESYEYPVQTKQQKAEKLVEEYINISNNPQAIKEAKFTKLDTSNSDSYTIGIIQNRWNPNQRFFGTEWFSINKDLTHIDGAFTR